MSSPHISNLCSVFILEPNATLSSPCAHTTRARPSLHFKIPGLHVRLKLNFTLPGFPIRFWLVWMAALQGCCTFTADLDKTEGSSALMRLWRLCVYLVIFTISTWGFCSHMSCPFISNQSSWGLYLLIFVYYTPSFEWTAHHRAAVGIQNLYQPISHKIRALSRTKQPSIFVLAVHYITISGVLAALVCR